MFRLLPGIFDIVPLPNADALPANGLRPFWSATSRGVH